jgi:hypothetical protein
MDFSTTSADNLGSIRRTVLMCVCVRFSVKLYHVPINTMLSNKDLRVRKKIIIKGNLELNLYKTESVSAK